MVYRILYRPGPHIPDLKELIVSAENRLAAIDRAREHLALRYPHYRLIGISAAADPASDWPAWAIQREGATRG